MFERSHQLWPDMSGSGSALVTGSTKLVWSSAVQLGNPSCSAVGRPILLLHVLAEEGSFLLPCCPANRSHTHSPRTQPSPPCPAVGGNDLLRGAMADPSGQEVERAAARLETFLDRLPLRPVLLGNVYDPTFGDDRCGQVASHRAGSSSNLRCGQVAPCWQQQQAA